MKIKRYNLIPSLLFVYLCVMSYIGYPSYRSGRFSAAYYFGSIALTICILVLLRYFLKKKEDYRRRRQEDIEKSGNQSGKGLR